MAYFFDRAESETIGESQFSGESDPFYASNWGYLDESANRIKFARNTHEAYANVYGICQMSSHGDGMPMGIIRSGPITISSIDMFPGPGVILFLGTNEHSHMRFSELASSAWITVLGYSTGLRTMMIDIRATGQQKP